MPQPGDGKLLKDFGHRPAPVPQGQTPPPLVENNQQTDVFVSGVAGFDFDTAAREVYIAETEFINKRILVYDMDTGAFKRGWGGKGQPLAAIKNQAIPPYNTLGPPPDIDDFVVLHCVHLSKDGLVYVCDRGNDRIALELEGAQAERAAWQRDEIAEASLLRLQMIDLARPSEAHSIRRRS